MVGGGGGGHEAERGEALGQLEPDPHAAVAARLQRGRPVRERAEVGAQQRVRVAAAAAEVLFFLPERALPDEVGARLGRAHRERARAVERVERVGKAVADEVEHAAVGGGECDLAGYAAPVLIDQPKVHLDRFSRPRFARRFDLYAKVLHAGVDGEGDVAGAELRAAEVLRRRRRGDAAGEEDDRDEGVRQVPLVQRDLDLRRAPHELHDLARQHALALDRHQRRRALERARHEDPGRLAGRVGRLLGHELQPLVVLPLPPDVRAAPAGRVEIGRRADRVAAHVGALGLDHVRAAVGDGEREPGPPPALQVDGLLGHDFFGALAAPPEPPVGADLAHGVPLPPHEPHLHALGPRRLPVRVDGDEVGGDGAGAVQVEVAGLRLHAEVEGAGVDGDGPLRRELLPARVGDGGGELEIGRRAGRVGREEKADAALALGVEHGVALGDARVLRGGVVVEGVAARRAEAVAVVARRAVGAGAADEAVAEARAAHRAAVEVAAGKRRLEKVARRGRGQRRLGAHGERRGAEGLDLERHLRHVAVVVPAARGGGGVRGQHEPRHVRPERGGGRHVVGEVERARRRREERPVEHGLVARAPDEHAHGVAEHAPPSAVALLAHDGFELGALAGAVEAAVGEDGAGGLDLVRAPVHVDAVAPRLDALGVAARRERLVALVAHEGEERRLVPPVRLLDAERAPPRRPRAARGVGGALPAHAAPVVPDLDLGSGHGRGAREGGDEDELVLRGELGRDAERGDLREPRPVAVALLGRGEAEGDEAAVRAGGLFERERDGVDAVAREVERQRAVGGEVRAVVPAVALAAADDLFGREPFHAVPDRPDVRQPQRERGGLVHLHDQQPLRHAQPRIQPDRAKRARRI